MPNATTADTWAELPVATEKSANKKLTMRNIFCIGECALDVVFNTQGQPVGAMPGGRIINAAAILSKSGMHVTAITEASACAVGDAVVKYLDEAGVDTSNIDRITEGVSPTLLYIPDANGQMTVTRYENYPDECFDVVWPRIERDDIVIFGGYYAIDPRMHRRMSQLLTHAHDRGAIMIYLPGFLPSQAPRITRVMPNVLDNLEVASIVISRTADLQYIFGARNAADGYENNIDFYCKSLINVDSTVCQLSYFTENQADQASIDAVASRSLIWNAGAVAGVVAEVINADCHADDFDTPSQELRQRLLNNAVQAANKAFDALTTDWQRQH
jgi:fructokinase